MLIFFRKPTTFETYIYVFYQWRSIHCRCSVRKGVLRNFTKFTRKYLCQILFFNKAAGLRPATLLKKRLWHRCFPVNVVEFLRTPLLQNTSGRLLLSVKSNYFLKSYRPLLKNPIHFSEVLKNAAPFKQKTFNLWIMESSRENKK